MKSVLLSFTVLMALFLATSTAHGKQRIVEFKGSEGKTTAEFEVRAPWIADWRTHGDYPGKMAVNINLMSSPAGDYVGKIVTTKYVDNGVRLFNEGGTFRFQVNSSLASWTLRVEELTRAEAEEYIPKNQEKKPRR
jgi:hypothetical protein